MAITNAQQFKQLVNPPMKGNKRPGYRGDDAYGGGSYAGGDRSDSPGDRGDGPATGAQFGSEKMALEKSLDIKEQPKGLGNLASLILSGVTKKLPFSFISKMDLSGPPQFAGLKEMDFGPADPKFLFPRMAQGPRTMGTMPTEEEEETPFRLAPRFRAEGGSMNDEVVGGEMDFESARQMYGLGKLVKKVTRTVKKIAKSPVGKAAILGLGAYYAPGFGIKAQGGLAPFLQSAKTSIGNFFLGIPGDTTGRVAGTGLLSKIGPLGAIAGVSALAGLLTAKQEEEAQELSRGEGIDIEAARRSILARAQGNVAGDLRATAFLAEGGKPEPVAKKTMPLLDMGGQEMDLRAEGGFVPIGRMEKADDVPARLSKNEFVFTADAVRNAGDGDVDKGAEVMYNMMKNLESGGDVSEESQGLEGARKMFQTSKRLEEVL